MGDSEETKYCSNCKRDIAAVNYVMHEVHCARNIVLCKKCDEPVPRSEMEEHEDEYHKLVPCDLCNKQFEVGGLDDHKANCDKRLVQCAYCEVDCTSDSLREHMDYCGARTEPCEKCSRNIMYKDRARHEDTNCDYPPRPEPETNPEPEPTDPAFGDAFGAIPFLGGFGMGGSGAPGEVSFRSGELRRLVEPHAGFGRPRPREVGAYGRTNTRVRGTTNPFSARSRGGLARVPQRRPPADTASTARNPVSYAAGSTTKTAKPRAPLHTRTHNTFATKNTNATRVQNVQKSNLRPRGGPPTGGSASRSNDTDTRPDMGAFDPDAALALQLHEELNSATDRIGDLDVDGFQGRNGSASNAFGDANEFGVNLNPEPFEVADSGAVAEEEEMCGVPCEFCEQTFPFDDIILHQSGCDHAPARVNAYDSMRNRPRHPDVNEFRPLRDEYGAHNEGLGRSVNDFSPTGFDDDEFEPCAAFGQHNDLGLAGFDGEGMTMLPCEFCGEAFPPDKLITHQPECDMNRTKTPRPPPSSHATPAGRATSRPGFRPGETRTSSAARVQRTLNTLLSDPTAPPLHLDSSSSSSTDAHATRGNATRPAYQPSFAPGHRSNKPRVVPPRLVGGEELEGASGRRTRVQNDAPGRKPRPQEH